MYFEPAKLESLKDEFGQFVIYGANGWMGRSTLEVITRLGIKAETILLVGSKPSTLILEGREFQIFDAKKAPSLLKPNSIFFNYAFLRREKLLELSPSIYTKKNLEIMQFSKEALSTHKVKCLINASSGVAARIEASNSGDMDPYAALKVLDEQWLEKVCFENSTIYINCRIYSLTGKHINEFENLALSNFVRDAIDKKEITVISPEMKRTIIDAMDLSRVLIALAMLKESTSLDSGGSLISMHELAKVVAENFDRTRVNIFQNNVDKSQYFGDFKRFNDTANQLGIELMGVDEQVALTARAISRAVKS